MQEHCESHRPGRANHGAVPPVSFLNRAERLQGARAAIIHGGPGRNWAELCARFRTFEHRHLKVLAAPVGAQPDDKPGEVPCAFDQLPVGAEASQAEVTRFCREHLAGFTTPRTIVFADLPKASAGKIQKFQLRARAKKMSS